MGQRQRTAAGRLRPRRGEDVREPRGGAVSVPVPAHLPVPVPVPVAWAGAGGRS
ncbi:hypothetical protein T261_03435 [Streptomyces lydicus]|nr:hypothetical protein T261_03435 [Streptomyces lydicus]